MKLALANLDSIDKEAFVPMPGGQPPMDPAMAQGGMPMDPAMAQGGMPMDPAMAGGMPPGGEMMADPMAGAGMPPPDAAMGAPPPNPEQEIYDMIVQAVRQVLQEMGIEEGGAEPKKAKKPSVDERLSAMEEMMAQLLGGVPVDGEPSGGGFGPGAGEPVDDAGAAAMMPSMGPLSPGAAAPMADMGPMKMGEKRLPGSVGIADAIARLRQGRR